MKRLDESGYYFIIGKTSLLKELQSTVKELKDNQTALTAQTVIYVNELRKLESENTEKENQNNSLQRDLYGKTSLIRSLQSQNRNCESGKSSCQRSLETSKKKYKLITESKFVFQQWELSHINLQ